MWLSRKRSGAKSLAAAVGTASIGGSSPAAVTQGEQRGLPLYVPGGYAWIPTAGEKLLIIKCGEDCGYPVVAASGNVQTPAGMQAGEVCISSTGGARLWLKNNGAIELTGRLTVNGQDYGEE